MDLKRKIEEKQQDIEKVLITLLFLTVLASLFLGDNIEVITLGVIVLQAALVLFYFLIVENRLYALFWSAFLLQFASYFLVDYLSDYLHWGLMVLPFFSFGILILIKGIRLSLKHKSFELLTFIVGFLMIIQVAMPFLQTNVEILTFYSFALSFAIGTIIYNDNLWHRYNSDEKNLLKFSLIVVLVIVLQSSAKFI